HLLLLPPPLLLATSLHNCWWSFLQISTATTAGLLPCCLLFGKVSIAAIPYSNNCPLFPVSVSSNY
ncbi:hypothetical protein PIB30_106307, partial [Stylosanthes scabra]|nr:hypothetical protein [Stylosanthes scabra]